MKIAVTAPTGHMGSKLSENLLTMGTKVVLLARDADKVSSLVQRGAEVREGDLTDSAFVTAATAGVDALFWLTPPNMSATDLRAFQNRCGQAAVDAIVTNRIPRVVNLSSMGAQLAGGAGPINGLHDVELMLDAAAHNIVHLRCGFFFENFLWQMDPIRESSSIFMTMPPSTRMPMVATRDIAEVAWRLLLDSNWRGRTVRGVQGPADLSMEEAAGEISRGLARNIRYVKVDAEQARRSMLSAGMSENNVDLMIEMYHGMEIGWIVSAERRSPETTTPTTLRQFAREVMGPMLRQTQTAGTRD